VTNKSEIAPMARRQARIPIPPPVLTGSGSTGSRPIRVSGRCKHRPPRGGAHVNGISRLSDAVLRVNSRPA
jgi:hypothetical protein